jgi:hypothetical protein
MPFSHFHGTYVWFLNHRPCPTCTRNRFTGVYLLGRNAPPLLEGYCESPHCTYSHVTEPFVVRTLVSKRRGLHIPLGEPYMLFDRELCTECGHLAAIQISRSRRLVATECLVCQRVLVPSVSANNRLPLEKADRDDLPLGPYDVHRSRSR